MPERLYAADTVTVKRSILATYAQCPDVEQFPSRIGTPEPMPSAADTKLRIDQLLANSRDSFPSYHAGLHVYMPPNAGRVTTVVQDSPIVQVSSPAAQPTAPAAAPLTTPQQLALPARHPSKGILRSFVKEAIQLDFDTEATRPDLIMPSPALVPDPHAVWSDESDEDDRPQSPPSSPPPEPTSGGLDSRPAIHPTPPGVQDPIARDKPEPDDARLTKARVEATKRIRGLKLKLPATRFIKDGTPDSVQNLRQYMHWLTGHLAESTVLRSAPYMDGGEILTALDQAHGCSDSCHCSACAEFKTCQSAIPRAPTQRPQCIEQVPRLYVDLCGKFATASVYHNFSYYLHAVTEYGYMLA